MSARHVIRLHEPVRTARTVSFSWSVEPATALYRRTSFELRFPDSVDLEQVPRAILWRVALICLHPHWALLRPCRVVLPVRLAPGEREFFSRLCDAEVAMLEAHVDGSDTARTIDVVETGPALEPLVPGADEGVVVACFSGGRDSITQAALLQELQERVVLVTTSSPREGSLEHETARRREVIEEIQRRRGLEVVEVGSDFRGAWDNGFVGARYPVAVNEVTDTLLFFAAALVVAAARGARAVYLAAEAEVQESVQRNGQVIQHRHAMYSAVTHRSLSALLEPARIHHSGLIYPLRQFQVQRLLATRYRDVRDLQYSCWSMAAGESACSRCGECRTIAFNLMAEGVSPSEIGIDVATLVNTFADWRPRPPEDGSLPVGRWAADMQMLRCLERLPPERMAPFMGAPATASLDLYAQMRDRALGDLSAAGPEPEPGYQAGFLELIDPVLRPRLGAIFDEHFTREPETLHAPHVERSLRLSDWITAPLRRPELDRRRPGARAASAAHATRPVRARPPARSVPSAAELAPIREQIPDPEPELVASPSGRIIRVAETLLEGNERRYVSECVETNWVSSAGSFVSRFEAAFADAVGCRYGVACSSGTAALHLALAAAGIGPGDEVIVPTFTMIASANAVGYVGARAVLVDADPGTWNLDIDTVIAAVGPRTRAIMVMHTYGHTVDMEAVWRVAAANDLIVIEDAAEAHGATYHGRPAGSLGSVAAFSFYGNKIITTGEGGMVTTDDELVAATARELRDHAFSRERHFWHGFRGFNYRMSNLQAALGLAQVERLEALVSAHRRIAGWYREALDGIPGLELPPRRDGHGDASWVFGCLVDETFGCSRDELRRHLAAEGIETRTFFVPIHLQPAYLTEHRGRRHPVAECLGRTGLYLPSGPALTREDVATVVEAIHRARATEPEPMRGPRRPR
ncbi:MAG TPA: DegT/DnrJ/EryC1/StrS family aminotransferase [Solirubrobacteraceae bacterium]|nr:DegT/DnrJ/EryC1/StrS family aminotransferase [Solirubrobacteraceae bacterium]